MRSGIGHSHTHKSTLVCGPRCLDYKGYNKKITLVMARPGPDQDESLTKPGLEWLMV